jgi:hypothetical protein
MMYIMWRGAGGSAQECAAGSHRSLCDCSHKATHLRGQAMKWRYMQMEVTNTVYAKHVLSGNTACSLAVTKSLKADQE